MIHKSIKILCLFFSLVIITTGCKKAKNIQEPEEIKKFREILKFPLPGYAQGLFLKDSVLFVADGQAGLAILNVKKLPDTIIKISQVETGYNAKSIVTLDSFAFIGFNDVNRKGIWVYNISNLENPVFLTGDEGMAYSYDLWLPPQDTNIIYSASGYYYFVFTTDYLPFYIYSKRFHPPGKVRGGFADSNYVYLACEQMGVSIYKALIPPDSEAFVSNFDTPNNARDITVKNNFAFVADGYGGLVVIDFSDTKNPLIISTLDLPGYSQKIKIDSNYVYVASGYGGIFKINISDPSNPLIEKEYKGSYSYDIEVDKEYVYVADRDFGIVVLEK